MDAEAYFDRIAPIYDAYYETIGTDDIEFYRDLGLEASTDDPVLEVGCGTGRIYLTLLEAGIDATGIDISGGMLEVHRHKVVDASFDAEPQVRQADVTSFEPRREYALAIVPRVSPLARNRRSIILPVMAHVP